MNIRERAEGTPIEDGAQITSTERAEYFIFRYKDRVVTVRCPKVHPQETDSLLEVYEKDLEKEPVV